MRYKPYIHPDQPVPRPCELLWHVLDDMQFPYVKMYWLGGNRAILWRQAYFVPAVLSFRPGIENRLAIDFCGFRGKWVGGNRRRSFACAQQNIEYMTIRRSDGYAEMMVAIRAIVEQLRSFTEYKPCTFQPKD